MSPVVDRRRKVSDFVDYDFENFDIMVRAAANIVRWNPSLSIEIMENAVSYMPGNEWKRKLYNNTVRHINETIESIEDKIYSDSDEYWKNSEPRLLEPIDNMITSEEYKNYVKVSDTGCNSL